MTQKEVAIQCLEKLDIYKPYIRKFKSQQTLPCFFENYGGFWVDQEPELYTKIKEVEKKFNVLVYAVTHEFVEDMEMWSMLCVPEDYESEIDVLDPVEGTKEFYAFSYIWNKSVEYFSEFGDIYIRSFGGGIKRIS